MIIKSLHLENIRSYKNDIIEFDEGINFLSGDIGSGKSTILLAIEFAFFGFKRGDLEAYHILRKGELEGTVRLTLIDKKTNIEIEIFRKLKKAKKTDTISQENGYIKIADDLAELSPQELNSQIFEILNFPKEFLTKDKNLIYRFTTYTPQEQLKEILFSNTEDNLEVIRKLFGIDNYKKLADAINIYLTNIKTEKKILESKNEGKEDIEKEINNLIEEIKNQKTNLQNLSDKEKPLKDKINQLKEALLKRDEFLDKLNNRKIDTEKKLSLIDELENQIKDFIHKEKRFKEILEKSKKSNLEGQIKDLNKNIDLENKQIQLIKDKLKDLEHIEDRRSELNKKKDIMKEELNSLNSRLEIIREKEKSFDYMLTKCKRKDCEVKISKLEKKLDKIEKIKKSIKEKNEEIIRFELDIKNSEKLIKEKDFQIDNISSLDNCPTCLQGISHDHKKDLSISFKDEKKKLNDNIKEIKLELIKEQNILKEKEKELDTLNQIQSEYNKENEKLNLLKEKESYELKLYDELKESKKKLSNLNQNNIKKEVEDITKKELVLDEKKKELEKIKEKELNHLNKISELKINILELENKQKEVSNTREELLEQKSRIDKIKEKVKLKESLKESLNKISKKENEVKDNRREFRDKLDLLHEKEKLLSSKISSIKTDLEAKNKELQDKEKTKNEKKELENKLKDIIYRESFLSENVIKISRLLEKYTFTKYYSEFNEEFEKLFKDLIEDNEIEVRLDELFRIIVEQNGYDISIKNLSGGEKSSLAIAYRLGLKKIIENNLSREQKLNLLILDEPTDGFSNEQIDRLGLLLKESTIPQILLVSHDEKIETIADSIINIEKTNHISKII